jgi:hypothetical protein
MQCDPRIMDMTLGDDFIGVLISSSPKVVSDFKRLRGYDRVKLRVKAKDY